MRLTRLAALAVAGLSPVLLVVAPGRAASTRPAGGVPLARCTARHGTIVAVDFAHWGGPIVRACGSREPSGFALLHAAGFTTAGDAHDGPGFVCRLGDAAFRGGQQYPTAAQTGCVLTPPTSGYWSYWLAPAGSDRWQDSQVGAMADVPRAGDVQLWIFGATDVAATRGSGVPRFSPAALRASARATTVGGGGPRLVDASASAVRGGSSGSPAGLVIGIAVAVGVGGAAGCVAWRRRRYE